MAETCRQPNKTDAKTVVFWLTYTLLICTRHNGDDTRNVYKIHGATTKRITLSQMGAWLVTSHQRLLAMKGFATNVFVREKDLKIAS